MVPSSRHTGHLPFPVAVPLSERLSEGSPLEAAMLRRAWRKGRQSVSCGTLQLWYCVSRQAVLCGLQAVLTCSIASLMLCSVQVVVLDEVATLFGCVCGLSPLAIGMSLVAAGTSLPDTFCSRTAALKDSHADAAVGNITGSNAANVFLGLGLPWLISSCYYAARGEKFCSDSGALAFSVLVYSGVALVWLAVLFGRRFIAGGELGAKSAFAKWGLFLLALCLWGIYLTLTGLVSEGVLDDSWIAVQAGSNDCLAAAVAR